MGFADACAGKSVGLRASITALSEVNTRSSGRETFDLGCDGPMNCCDRTGSLLLVGVLSRTTPGSLFKTATCNGDSDSGSGN